MTISAARMGVVTPITRKRALVVDGDELFLEIASAWLTEAGYRVIACGNFSESKEHLAKKNVDLLVTDVRLGMFNGLQLVMLGRIQRPDMRAVVLTRFDDPVLRREAQAESATFLLKPVTAGQLLSAIDDQENRTIKAG
jgi:two-component system phosphoglycerate transport system response regulator PgtA